MKATTTAIYRTAADHRPVVKHSYNKSPFPGRLFHVPLIRSLRPIRRVWLFGATRRLDARSHLLGNKYSCVCVVWLLSSFVASHGPLDRGPCASSGHSAPYNFVDQRTANQNHSPHAYQSLLFRICSRVWNDSSQLRRQDLMGGATNRGTEDETLKAGHGRPTVGSKIAAQAPPGGFSTENENDFSAF